MTRGTAIVLFMFLTLVNAALAWPLAFAAGPVLYWGLPTAALGNWFFVGLAFSALIFAAQLRIAYAISLGGTVSR